MPHGHLFLTVPLRLAAPRRLPRPATICGPVGSATGPTRSGARFPFLLATLDDATAESLEGYGASGFPAEESGRPWDNDEFDDPADIRELDHIDAGQLLAELWDGQVPSEEEDDDDEWRAMRAPFVRLFRGRHRTRRATCCRAASAGAGSAAASTDRVSGRRAAPKRRRSWPPNSTRSATSAPGRASTTSPPSPIT